MSLASELKRKCSYSVIKALSHSVPKLCLLLTGSLFRAFSSMWQGDTMTTVIFKPLFFKKLRFSQKEHPFSLLALGSSREESDCVVCYIWYNFQVAIPGWWSHLSNFRRYWRRSALPTVFKLSNVNIECCMYLEAKRCWKRNLTYNPT